MAVTIQPSDLVAALRLGDTAEELAEVTRILAYATDAVVVHVPNAPDTAHNEAVRRLVGYLFDQPEAGRGDAYANALRNSGAQRMLLPYRRHRAGYADSDAVADAQSAVGTAGNPVVDVRIDGTHLVITFADGTHDTEELPSSGGGVDGVARTAAAAAQTSADAAGALAVQNEAFKLELPDLVPGVGIALIPSGSRELTISTTGSISGPEELVGGQWQWVVTNIADPGEVMYAGDVVLGQIDTWTFAASGAYFGAQAQMVVLMPGDTIEIRQNASRYQTIELSSEPTVSSNVVTVLGYAHRGTHTQIPQSNANVTITIAPGPLQGEDKIARRAAATVQDNLDDHEASTHNTDENARTAAAAHAAAAGGGAAAGWYWLSQAVGPFTANTAKDASTILQFPGAGYADYAALRAAVLDQSVTQVVIRVSETDVGGSDDDGANFIIPNVLGFFHGSTGNYRAFPAWNVGVDPVKFDVVFGVDNITVTTDAAVGASQTVIVRVGIWS